MTDEEDFTEVIEEQAVAPEQSVATLPDPRAAQTWQDTGERGVRQLNYYAPPQPPDPRSQMEAYARLYQNRSIAEAERAVTAARTMIGSRMIQKELGEGKSPAEVFMRWAPDAFARTPQVIPNILKQVTPPAPPVWNPPDTATGRPGYFSGGMVRGIQPVAPPTGPIQGESMLGPDGKPLPGVVGFRGRGGAIHRQTVKPETIEATPQQILSRLIARQNNIRQQLALSPDEATQAQLLKELKDIGDDMREPGRIRFPRPEIKEPTGGSTIPHGTAKSAAPAVLPYPKSKAEAVVDSIYQTRQGPMRWDGEKFVLP